jgi:hypothetical protein
MKELPVKSVMGTSYYCQWSKEYVYQEEW